MAQRLIDLYQPGDPVEINLAASQGDNWQPDNWQPGRILRHDPPGVWVQMENGRQWFVTNGRKIRKPNAS
jgi:hypothetical protein